MDSRTLCLGTLILGDASGYEIRKMFEEGPFAHFQDAGYGSIYPALRKLLDEGLVAIIAPAPEATEGERGHPDKKIYAITDAGRAAFREALAITPGRDKIRSDACFLMFFADWLEPAHLARVFDDYLAHFKDRAAFVKSLDPEGVPPGRLFTRGLGVAFYEAIAAYMEANRDMLMQTRPAAPVEPARPADAAE